MAITEMSILHHMGVVLLGIWLLSYLDRCHPVVYLLSIIYLYLVHERYVMRLRRKLQFEERKQANQRRVLTDSETVRWLNYAVERIWPICMEQIASQKILLPIIPWFLEKYKPWSAKKAVVQHLYLGRNPPVFTEMRVLRHSTDDDHLVLELGMNFLTAEDMSAILAVKLRKRLGFGMWAKMHLTGMHIEGKVLIGVKFLRHWPFLGRLRVCFAEPPYFQMTVKPIFTHGLDVTEFPGIAGWLDKLLSVAFEETLVEPNMLVVDMKKFVSPQSEPWFSVDVKEPVAYAKVEVIEASDMKPSDLNGLADPYVKGQLGSYRFRTKTQRKTLTPTWQEDFKIPICTWESPNVLTIEVRDKDHFVDDTLGDCSVNITELRDRQRHDMWLPLKNIKMGRLHLAITVLEDNEKEIDIALDNETFKMEDIQKSFGSETANKASSSSSMASPKSPKMGDTFEAIDIEGQKQTGIWVCRPGSEVSQSWEPRKGSRHRDTEIQGDSATMYDENGGGKNPVNKVQRGLKKIGSVFHRNSRKEDSSGSIKEDLPSPHVNLREVNAKGIAVNFIAEDSLSVPSSGEIPREDESISPERSGSDSPRKVKDMAKSILKHAGKSARSIKHALSRKASKNSRGNSSALAEIDTITESNSSESSSSSGVELNAADNESSDSKELPGQTDLSRSEPPTDANGLTDNVNPEWLERIDNEANRSHKPADTSTEGATGSMFSNGNTQNEKDEALSSGS